jgi:tetratricopeptide (TPR) repeat protein
MNRSRWLAWILGVAVAVAAMPDTAQANKHLKRAHKAYAKLKYELVIKHLKRAIKIAKTPKEQVEIHEFLGRMYVMYGKDAEAKASFVEVLKRDPAFTLPDTESPKILATLDEARAEVGGVMGGVVTAGDPPPPDDVVTSTDPPPPPVDDGVAEEIVAAPTDNTVETDATKPPDPMLTTTVESSSEFYETWWFWTAVGVVVAGAATGATLAVTMKPGPPDGDFGEPVQLP